jgi:OOP family OmpA-OmpF porin
MRVYLATTCMLAGALLAGGCATKTYVRNTTAPIQAKVDQVGSQTTQNSQQIEDTKGQLKQVDDRAQSGINAAQERASAADQHAAAADQHAGLADQHASDAMNRAKQTGEDLNKLRVVVSNIDDYKLQTSTSVPFAFDKFGLTASAKEDLDTLAGSLQNDKRFVISVEGFTDSTGNKTYNEALSRKRADAVVSYLVAKHDIPIYRIHMIGLGQEKPVDDARTRDARAKNRRVEVKVFSADQVTATLGENSANRAETAGHQ